MRSVACDEWKSSINGLCGSYNVPTAPPTPSPVTPPTSDVTCTRLVVDFRSDDWPEDYSIVLKGGPRTFWDIQDLEPKTNYRWSRCIRNDVCTLLHVTDTYGDGFNGDGYMKVTLGSTVLFDGWDLGFGFSASLGNGC